MSARPPAPRPGGGSTPAPHPGEAAPASAARQLLEDGIRRLASNPKRAESARPDARELLSRLLGISLSQLSAGPAPSPGAEFLVTWERWLTRRLAGEPVQYITGRAAFRSLDLQVDPRVLIPRPETEGLVEAVLEILRSERTRWPHPRVLDLGTGSGAIALAIASEWPSARVTATEASEGALEVARANAGALGLAERVRFEQGDWFAAPGAEQRFEAVVSNPPYIAETERAELPEDVRDFEPAIALYSGPAGTEALREIVDEAPRHLVAGGLLALELAEDRAPEILYWLEGAQDWERAELRSDLSGQPRILLARRARGPAIAPEQWIEQPPLS